MKALTSHYCLCSPAILLHPLWGQSDQVRSVMILLCREAHRTRWLRKRLTEPWNWHWWSLLCTPDDFSPSRLDRWTKACQSPFYALQYPVSNTRNNWKCRQHRCWIRLMSCQKWQRRWWSASGRYSDTLPARQSHSLLKEYFPAFHHEAF